MFDLGSLVPVLSVAMPFVMVILVVWFSLSQKMKKDKLKADLYGKAIEKGQTLPENFFANEKKPKSALQKGIMWIAVGIGVSLFFAAISFTGEKDAMKGVAIGIIPFFVGLGFLVVHFLEKKQPQDGEQ